jgi:Protein of unknown function (DUF3159)
MTTLRDKNRPDTASRRTPYGVPVRAAARAAIRPGGQASSLVTTAAPTLVFVGADAIGGLRSALIATAVSGVLVLAWRLRARSHVAHAVIGTLLAIVCAAVAAGTGQARSFFLLPMLLPAAATMACLLSILAGRPLAGLVANRIVGGPRDWRSHRPLHRFYRRTTLVISLVSFVSLSPTRRRMSLTGVRSRPLTGTLTKTTISELSGVVGRGRVRRGLRRWRRR